MERDEIGQIRNICEYIAIVYDNSLQGVLMLVCICEPYYLCLWYMSFDVVIKAQYIFSAAIT